jgi:hypothetical protein
MIEVGLELMLLESFAQATASVVDALRFEQVTVGLAVVTEFAAHWAYSGQFSSAVLAVALAP